MSYTRDGLGSNPIEWTTKTWNPSTGCTKASEGCKHCYAEVLAKRLQAMGNPRYLNGFEVTLHRDKVDEPRRWRKGEWVFVNSMSDILHEDIPDDFILDVFATMVETPQHRYQALSKRPERWERITELVVERWGAWPQNVLPGTSLENRRVLHDLGRLANLGRAGDENTVRMISAEPLISSLTDGGDVEGLAIELMDAGIGWVISGGEAGFKARPAALNWFREIRDACALAGIPFFHKQHGGRSTTKAGKRGGTLAVLDGVLHHEMPAVMATEETPRLFG